MVLEAILSAKEKEEAAKHVVLHLVRNFGETYIQRPGAKFSIVITASKICDGGRSIYSKILSTCT